MKAKPDAVRKAFPDLERMQNREWAEKIVNVWCDVWEESNWENITDCPYNELVPKISLVEHINQVVRGASDLASRGRESVGLRIDEDLLVVAGLIHDVSKMVEYEPGPDGKARKSDLGKRYQHAVYGAFKAEAEGFPPPVVQIIINHTPSSNEIPNTPEALCIYYSDMCAADLARLDSGITLLVESHK